MSQRVVITGIGTISPLGLDTKTTWAGLLAGRSGVERIASFDTTGYNTIIAGEIKGFDATKYLDRKEARHTDRFSQFAIAATKEALQESGLNITAENAADVGVVIGTGTGGIMTLSDQLATLIERGPDRVSPFLVPMMICNSAAGQVSITIGAQGPTFATLSACCSGADALGEAAHIIRRGDAKVMIAGGSEAGVCPIGIAGFSAARALSTRNDDPSAASRPFDMDRDGFVLADGACVMILEDLEYAVARGATIIAELAGYGATADAYHMTAPRDTGDGAVRAIRRALQTAGVSPDQMSYVNAHGTSTKLNDKIETIAIKTVLGAHAYQTPVSSTKSMTGHMIGAAGAIEAAVCALAIRDGVIPPTINLSTPDPDCDLDYVPNQARRVDIEVAMSNSLGFGGHNSCLVLKKYRA